jgi:hypothetical protein
MTTTTKPPPKRRGILEGDRVPLRDASGRRFGRAKVVLQDGTKVRVTPDDPENRTTTVKDPLSGKMKQVDRPKEEWGTQERSEMRILSDEQAVEAAQRWVEIAGVFPSKRKGKKGFEGKQRSYVDSHLRKDAPSCSAYASVWMARARACQRTT